MHATQSSIALAILEELLSPRGLLEGDRLSVSEVQEARMIEATLHSVRRPPSRSPRLPPASPPRPSLAFRRTQQPRAPTAAAAPVAQFSVLAIAGLGLARAGVRVGWKPCSLIAVGVLAFAAPISYV